MLCRGEFGSQGTSQEDIGQEMTLPLPVVGVGLGARVQSHEDRCKADKLQFLHYHGVGLDIHVGCDNMRLQKNIQMIHSF